MSSRLRPIIETYMRTAYFDMMNLSVRIWRRGSPTDRYGIMKQSVMMVLSRMGVPRTRQTYPLTKHSLLP